MIVTYLVAWQRLLASSRHWLELCGVGFGVFDSGFVAPSNRDSRFFLVSRFGIWPVTKRARRRLGIDFCLSQHWRIPLEGTFTRKIWKV